MFRIIVGKLLLLSFSLGLAAEESGVDWRKFDAAALAQAREEKKLVFLDMEAVWCHWCHVMDKETFSLPEVQQALRDGFISTKVDQDSRPDLSRRYEEYGWPALVILDPVTMKERAIASGFQTREEFLDLLKRGQGKPGKVILDENANPPAEGALTLAQRKSLLGRLAARYDTKATGWGSGSKFVPWGNIELCVRLDREGDVDARKMAQDTLTSAMALVDPVWGGVYQYSTHGDWVHPHFEKIMEFEAEISRIYVLAWLAWKRPADLKAAEDIARHLHDFLRSPEGAFHVSQDADVVRGEHSAGYFNKDDPGRRASGVPRVDKHVYSRENGLAIRALTALYQATGRESYLDDATTAAEWIIAHRSLEGGGFSHDETDSHGPFLSDQVEMGRALLDLYQATSDRRWLRLSMSSADFCERNFPRGDVEGGGYLAGRLHDDSPPPVVDQDENIAVARWLNLLGKTTREPRFGKGANHAMRYLATERVTNGIYSFVGGLMLADKECAGDPVHIAIVGKREDAVAKSLFDAARRQPSFYKVIEWIAPGDPIEDGGIRFPDMGQAAAYSCTENRCSAPQFNPGDLEALFSRK